MKLQELLENGYGDVMGLNCAEKIVYGASWAYDLKLPPVALKLSAGFGGGMGVEGICGAATGAIMVLSHLYVNQNAHESTRIKELGKEFLASLQEELEFTDCKNLKAKYRHGKGKCNPIIFKAAEILDAIVEREGL